MIDGFRQRMAAALALLVVVTAQLCAPSASAAQSTPHESLPLQIEDALSLARYREFSISPDGEWLVYAYLAGDSSLDDDVRRRVRVTPLKGGPELELEAGPSGASINGAPWSPDGQRLAFTSDATGRPLLWIWSRALRTSRPIEAALMYDVGWDGASWFRDSDRVVAALWPEDEPHPATNSDEPVASSPLRPAFRKSRESGASLFVYSARKSEARPRLDRRSRGCDRPPFGRCDLAVIDVRDGSVQRLARRVALGWFHEPSPDGLYVAYAVAKGQDTASQEMAYDLHVYDLRSRTDRIVAGDVYNYAGKLFTWSPDSRSLAFVAPRVEYSGTANRQKTAISDLYVASATGASLRRMSGAGFPDFYGRGRVLWSADGRSLFAVSVDSKLWQVDVRSATARELAGFRGLKVISPLVPRDAGVMSTTDCTRQIAVVAEDPVTSARNIYALDLAASEPRKLMDGATRFADFDVSPSSGAVVFKVRNENTGLELRVWRCGDKTMQRAGSLSGFPSDVEPARLQAVSWRNGENQPLAGVLMLPPGYAPGQRLPLVVWVYGGSRGEAQARAFGSSGSAALNLQILATRGYAVFFPDAPQRLGRPLKDLFDNVMPGVDAVIAQGYADEDRLAIMGQSYGSYSALSLITQTTRFKAAVISAVVHPDLATQYLNMRGDGQPAVADAWAEAGGGLMGVPPWENPQRYVDNSPLYRFDRIETPLLIGQGEWDYVTPPAGANAVFAALRRLGKEVEYRIYEGEGHVLQKRESVIDFWNRRLQFLADHLDIAFDEDDRMILEDGRARSRQHPIRTSQSTPHD